MLLIIWDLLDIVESIALNNDWYAIPSEIFTESCETTWTGYWLGRDGQQDYFILDLMTTEMIHKVHLKNTYNNGAYDRATNAFNVDVSNDTVTWVNAVDNILIKTMSPHLPCEDIPVQKFAVEKVARYLRFKIISNHAWSGGLNYIKVV